MTAARGPTAFRAPAKEALFEVRARRLSALAPGNPAGPFLQLLADVATGQHVAAQRIRVPAGAHLLDGAPLDHRRLDSALVWREILTVVLDAVDGSELPSAAQAAVARLRAMSAGDLDRAAAAALQDVPPDLATAPFLAAVRQVHHVILAAALDPDLVGEGSATCPVCAARPVAGTIGGDDRARHLWCGLCGSGWRATRTQCIHCSSGAALSYLGLEEALPGVQVEACSACGRYVKLFDLATRAGVEPLADDVATMVLDVLMAEEGYGRATANPLAASGGQP